MTTPANVQKRSLFEQAETELRGEIFRSEDLSNCSTGENVTFIGCDFSAANLSGADLSGVSFEDCKFLQTNFENASLLGVTFDSKCDLTSAILRNSDCRQVEFGGSSLEHVDASGAVMRQANFANAKPTHAIFDRADLSGAKALIPDRTRMASSLMTPDSEDPWSRLKTDFTGLRFIMSLLPVAVFVSSLLFKTYAIVGYTLYMRSSAGSAPLAPCGDQGTSCSQWHVWQVVSGLYEGWLAFAFVAVSVLYNALRWVLTLRVDRLAISEKTSGTTPPYGTLGGYGILSKLQPFVAAAKWVFFALFAWNMGELLMQTVMLPNR